SRTAAGISPPDRYPAGRCVGRRTSRALIHGVARPVLPSTSFRLPRGSCNLIFCDGVIPSATPTLPQVFLRGVDTRKNKATRAALPREMALTLGPQAPAPTPPTMTVRPSVLTMAVPTYP